MELIQNAEDNEHLEGVDPSLEFVITSQDITATGALATLLMFNNENGFSSKNIESLCSIGSFTKKGNRKHGYIGEKDQASFCHCQGGQVKEDPRLNTVNAIAITSETNFVSTRNNIGAESYTIAVCFLMKSKNLQVFVEDQEFVSAAFPTE
ncbi:hypothetical protein COLO4_16666 [Corchorus olitorius]|uniref:Uncharacterized protein n=1 Tax=Corchorus olitorius TaxID=93759 RepID=A0A1R3JG60_9ROSI|nr:hypothetical protein COLO4_16666 [Corchorus olitorius]